MGKKITRIGAAEAERYLEDPEFSVESAATIDLDAAEIFRDWVDPEWPDYGLPPLYLNGLTDLQTEVVDMLSSRNEHLHIYLDGLIEISPELATSLSKLKCNLHLNGITHLDNEIFKILFKNRAKQKLSLNGLNELSAAAAKAISKCFIKGHSTLYLNGLEAITAEAASYLTAVAELHLNGLASIDPQTAEAIILKDDVSHHTELHINGISNLDEKAAKILSADQRTVLHLCGLKELSESAATEIANFKRTLHIGVANLTPSIAAILATHQRDLILDNESIPDGALKAFIDNYNEGGYDQGGKVISSLSLRLKQLKPKQAEILSKVKLGDVVKIDRNRTSEFYGSLILDHLQELAADSASHLSNLKGDLSLKGLAALSNEAADALSSHAYNLTIGPDADAIRDGATPITISEHAVQVLSEKAGGFHFVSEEEASDLI